MEELSEPVDAVPVSVAVVLPVGPVVPPLPLLPDDPELPEELLPPPPQAAIVRIIATARAASTGLHLRALPRPPNHIATNRPIEARLTPAAIGNGFTGKIRRAGPVMLAVVVFTVTVTGMPVVEEVDEVNTTELGLKLHVAAVGRPEQARFTVPVNPFTG